MSDAQTEPAPQGTSDQEVPKGTCDQEVPKGTWVEIRSVVLEPSQRAAGVPADTAATPLVQWIDGFLDADAHPGDEVTITTIIGRRHRGTLDRVNPSYSHSFGDTVPELLTIGTQFESTEGGRR